MPIYICNILRGCVPGDVKRAIANDITVAHCAIARTPRNYVHVLFFEDATMRSLQKTCAMVFGCIHTGCSDEQRDKLVKSAKVSFQRYAGLHEDEIVAGISEFPSCSVMEHGMLISETAAAPPDAKATVIPFKL